MEKAIETFGDKIASAEDAVNDLSGEILTRDQIIEQLKQGP